MGGDYNYREPVKNLNAERNILCYCNFTFNTHNDREKIYRKIKDQWVRILHKYFYICSQLLVESIKAWL